MSDVIGGAGHYAISQDSTNVDLGAEGLQCPCLCYLKSLKEEIFIKKWKSDIV
jgi:hypothetical protein